MPSARRVSSVKCGAEYLSKALRANVLMPKAHTPCMPIFSIMSELPCGRASFGYRRVSGGDMSVWYYDYRLLLLWRRITSEPVGVNDLRAHTPYHRFP